MAQRHQLIVDGYNYILRTENQKINEQNHWAARDRLIRALQNHAADAHIQITVDFDGD